MKKHDYVKQHDYVAYLNELPAKHSGFLMEQLNQAALSASFYMRAMGLSLPGREDVPTHAEVLQHLSELTNHALGSYFEVQKVEAPEGQPANEIWGEDSDDLFTIEVSGISAQERDGFTVSVNYNLLYR